jgi:hypothetical protein
MLFLKLGAKRTDNSEMPKIRLPWPLDRNGYHIKESAKGKTIAAPAVVSIVRNGGELVWCDRLKIDGLYRRLADCPPTESGALAFVSRYGFLRGGQSEPVEFICNEIRAVRGLLKLKDARDWKRLHLWSIDNPKIGVLRRDLLAGDPPQLFFRPVTLQDAIYLQFFEDLSTDANLRLCNRRGCGAWFKYGPGTDHRSTAQYCSPRCHKSHTYAMQKERQS